MSKMKFKKRNRLDIIITDTRPVELVKLFSLSQFYDFLNNSKQMSDMLDTSKKKSVVDTVPNKDILWGTRWHAAPLKYHIYKNRYEMRELSLLSPVSMIELSLFLEVFEKQLLSLSEFGFSVRKHKINEMLKYRKIVCGCGVEYEYDKNEFDATKLEASGCYYLVYPYRFLQSFQSSDEWHHLNCEYQFFGKIDYNKCFDSIYTHTFTWIIAKNSIDGKSYGRDNNYFLNICDKLMQNLNGSVTNGIVVGPEFSRMMSELITQNIDQNVFWRLGECGLSSPRDYRIARYVDDIYIFATDETIVDRIISLFREEAEKFHLKINERKCITGRLPHVWTRWIDRISTIKNDVKNALIKKMDNEFYLVTNSNSSNIKRRVISNVKIAFQDLIADFPEDQQKISAYILKVIYNDLANIRTPCANGESIDKITVFLDSVFYFYSFGLSFTNTEILISILSELWDLIPEVIFKESFEIILRKYSIALSRANPEDICNLLLLVSMYKIELSHNIEKVYEDKITRGNNPLMYALLLRYYSAIKEDKSFKEKVEKKIEDSIEIICSNYNFFQYPDVWWLLIFVNCNIISPKYSQMISNKLENQLNFLDRMNTGNDEEHMAARSMRLVLEFLLDKNIQFKFINWELTQDELYKETVFTTYQRTLFNGYNGNPNQEFINEY